ncbi:MAG: hypothetical protein ACERIE_08220 [Methyloceanibacter sp.]|jgi:hypothetical protein|nr:hypothetical protein [Methyloceanibacter sp.]
MTDSAEPITIRNIDIPFWRIVAILIKWSIAAIPAMIVIAVLYTLIFGILGGVGVVLVEVLGLDVSEMVPTPPAQ